MKTVKKMAAIVLVGAMALSIAACKKSAKKVSADDFKKACEEVGLTVTDLGASDGAKEQYEAVNADQTIEATYVIAESKDDAKKGFDMIADGTDSLKEMGADVKKSSGKIEVSMGDAMYMVAVQADDMFLSITATGSADDVNTAKDLVKKLGV